MRFEGLVELGGKTATGIAVPADVVDALAAGKRPPVRVTVGQHTYRTTVAPMSGRFFVPLSAEHRQAAGVAAGQTVEVDIELDREPRLIEPPTDLAEALAQHDAARAFFDGLSFSHRKEWVRWIEEARTLETRRLRLTRTIEALNSGKRSR